MLSTFVQSLLVYAPDAQRIPIDLAAQWDEAIARAARRCLKIHPTTSGGLVFASPEFGGLGFPSCVAGVMATDFV